MFPRRWEGGGAWELTEMEMVSPGTISRKMPEFPFVSMTIFMPPVVFVFFSVQELPLDMSMLSLWKDWLSTHMFECPLSPLEPGYLILGSGKEFPRESSERRRNCLYSMISRRRKGGGAWELRTEMDMVSPGTISRKVPEFPFVSMMIFMPLVFVFFSIQELPLAMAMLSVWKDWLYKIMFECPLSRLEPGFLILGPGNEFPGEDVERRRNGLFSMISRRGKGGPWELRTETGRVFPGTMSPKVPGFHFASMRIFMPLIPSVVVFFSVRKLPLTLTMGIVVLSFWEAFPNTFEGPLSRFEPGFLVLGSGTESTREASDRRRNGLFSTERWIFQDCGYELRTETEMISISLKLMPEFHFASIMMMLASGAVDPQFFYSFSEENGIALSFSFSQGGNEITFSFSRTGNEITCSSSQAEGHAGPVVGSIEGLITIPWPAENLANVHLHLVLPLAR